MPGEAHLLRNLQSLLKGLNGSFRFAGSSVDDTDPIERRRFLCAIAGLLKQRQRFRQGLGRVTQFSAAHVQDADRACRSRHPYGVAKLAIEGQRPVNERARVGSAQVSARQCGLKESQRFALAIANLLKARKRLLERLDRPWPIVGLGGLRQPHGGFQHSPRTNSDDVLCGGEPQGLDAEDIPACGCAIDGGLDCQPVSTLALDNHQNVLGDNLIGRDVDGHDLLAVGPGERDCDIDTLRSYDGMQELTALEFDLKRVRVASAQIALATLAGAERLSLIRRRVAGRTAGGEPRQSRKVAGQQHGSNEEADSRHRSHSGIFSCGLAVNRDASRHAMRRATQPFLRFSSFPANSHCRAPQTEE